VPHEIVNRNRHMGGGVIQTLKHNAEPSDAAVPDRNRIGSEEAPVELKNVSYAIARTPVLDDISFSVSRGEVLGVMGMSGCGKSTLLKLIMGLIRPGSGAVLIDGQDISGLSERELNKVRRKIGMCFQSAALFDSMTIAENVAFSLRRQTGLSRRDVQEVVEECLNRVGLTGSDDAYPAELSGGMRKRAGIARAIAAEPEIMLYDEPSSGLDPVMASVIDGLIMYLADDLGVTSIVVSHHVGNLFSVADRVIMLYDRRIEQVGTPQQVTENGTAIVQQFVHGQPTGPIIV
jgi:phospholipid/cholesterol/gamma-HCH transport system ATP-binding protein